MDTLSQILATANGNPQTMPISSTAVNIPLQNPPPPVIPTATTKPVTKDPIDSIMDTPGLTDEQFKQAIHVQHMKDQDEANKVLYNLNPDGTPKPELHDYISRTLEKVKYLRNKVANNQ